MVGLLMCNLYFYPRSPCGERLQWEGMRSLSEVISIHALLAESDKDTLTDDVSTGGFLSTLSLRRATRAFLARPFLLQFLSTLSLRRATVYPGTWSGSILISIHALLAESDLRVIVSSILQTNFYPRSPCGERLAKLYYFACPFLFLSTLSLRRATGILAISLRIVFAEFLSTLSLRRATAFSFALLYSTTISIHALLAESDGILGRRLWYREQFLSTLSLRRATKEVTYGRFR